MRRKRRRKQEEELSLSPKEALLLDEEIEEALEQARKSQEATASQEQEGEREQTLDLMQFYIKTKKRRASRRKG